MKRPTTIAELAATLVAAFPADALLENIEIRNNDDTHCIEIFCGECEQWAPIESFRTIDGETTCCATLLVQIAWDHGDERTHDWMEFDSHAELETYLSNNPNATVIG